MKIKHFLLILSILIEVSCKNNTHNVVKSNVPRDLNEAIALLNADWNIVQKTRFKYLPEQEAVTSLHFSTGLWVRNNWIRGNRDTILVNYFNKIGIYSPDDMSSIILTSFHRKLNNKELDLSSQVKKHQSYWKSIDDCETKAKKLAIENYHKYNVGSLITILMPVDISDNHRNATIFNCPTGYWKFNYIKDLKINGVIIEKHFINDTSNVFFEVRINKMNFPNTEILMDKKKVGDTETFSLLNLMIK